MTRRRRRLTGQSRSTTPPCATAPSGRACRSRSRTSCASLRKLDELGIHYVEGGFPASNPKDVEFFAPLRARSSLAHAGLVAFGSTRRKATIGRRQRHGLRGAAEAADAHGLHRRQDVGPARDARPCARAATRTCA